MSGKMLWESPRKESSNAGHIDKIKLAKIILKETV